MNLSKDPEKVFPASKKITIGTTSSLVDLKAELFRSKAEAANKVKDVKTIASSSKNEKWKAQAGKLEAMGKLKEIKPERRLKQAEVEDNSKLDDDLKKSREALERKTKIYEARYNRAVQDVFKGNCDSDGDDDEEGDPELVNFKAKVISDSRTGNLDNKEPSPDEDFDDADWVEFTDSLGRTRRCLKQDLEHYKKLDEESLTNYQSRSNNEEVVEDGKDDSNTDENPHKYPHFVHERSLDNFCEEGDEPVIGPVHYRDVQKDEVREHGVGFFAFSSDDLERKKQRELLDNLRDQTQKSRFEAVKLKEKRKLQKINRLRKIAERKGIPFSDHDVKSSSDSEDDMSNFKATSTVDQFAKRDREVERLKHLMTREWDVGKKDDSGRTIEQLPEIEAESKLTTKGGHREYIKNQREERKQEFAPPTFYFDNIGTTSDADSHIKGFNSRPSTKKFKPSTSQQDSVPLKSDEAVNINQILEEKLKQFKYNS